MNGDFNMDGFFNNQLSIADPEISSVIDKEKRDPLNLQYEIASRINTHCQNLGLIVRPLFNTCVMSPSLIIEESEIDELVRILREGIILAT